MGNPAGTDNLSAGGVQQDREVRGNYTPSRGGPSAAGKAIYHPATGTYTYISPITGAKGITLGEDADFIKFTPEGGQGIPVPVKSKEEELATLPGGATANPARSPTAAAAGGGNTGTPTPPAAKGEPIIPLFTPTGGANAYIPNPVSPVDLEERRNLTRQGVDPNDYDARTAMPGGRDANPPNSLTKDKDQPIYRTAGQIFMDSVREFVGRTKAWAEGKPPQDINASILNSPEAQDATNYYNPFADALAAQANGKQTAGAATGGATGTGATGATGTGATGTGATGTGATGTGATGTGATGTGATGTGATGTGAAGAAAGTGGKTGFSGNTSEYNPNALTPLVIPGAAVNEGLSEYDQNIAKELERSRAETIAAIDAMTAEGERRAALNQGQKQGVQEQVTTQTQSALDELARQRAEAEEQNRVWKAQQEAQVEATKRKQALIQRLLANQNQKRKMGDTERYARLADRINNRSVWHAAGMNPNTGAGFGDYGAELLPQGKIFDTQQNAEDMRLRSKSSELTRQLEAEEQRMHRIDVPKSYQTGVQQPGIGTEAGIRQGTMLGERSSYSTAPIGKDADAFAQDLATLYYQQIEKVMGADNAGIFFKAALANLRTKSVEEIQENMNTWNTLTGPESNYFSYDVPFAIKTGLELPATYQTTYSWPIEVIGSIIESDKYTPEQKAMYLDVFRVSFPGIAQVLGFRGAEALRLSFNPDNVDKPGNWKPVTKK